jgi:transposase-like protein
MPPAEPPYPPEFRREAVQLTRTSERSIAQVARDLGVSNQTLRNWIKQADVDAGKREGLSPSITRRTKDPALACRASQGKTKGLHL